MRYNQIIMKQQDVLLRSFLLFLTLVLLAGCGGEPAPAPAAVDLPEPIPVETVYQAQALVANFKSTLKAALMEGLADGPVQAIGACSIQAPELIAELSVDGIRIGRTSKQLRNPKNAPAEWLVPLLEEYEGSTPGTESQAVRIDATTIGYVDPLYVGKPCLTCHGTAIPQAVEDEIVRLYPEDQAVDLAEGSFRGLVWVEIQQNRAL
jgi:hypothetical protein